MCRCVGVWACEMLHNVYCRIYVSLMQKCVCLCQCIYYRAMCGQLGLHKDCTILRTNILLAAALTQMGFIREPSLSLSLSLFEEKVTHRAGSVFLFDFLFRVSTCVFSLSLAVSLLLVLSFFSFFSLHSILPLHLTLQWSSQTFFFSFPL